MNSGKLVQGEVAPAEPARDLSAIAAAALAAVAGAGGSDAARKGKTVTIVEKRRFAGQEVVMSRELQAGSKEATTALAKEATAGKAGLDAMLQQIAGTTIDLVGGFMVPYDR